MELQETIYDHGCRLIVSDPPHTPADEITSPQDRGQKCHLFLTIHA